MSASLLPLSESKELHNLDEIVSYRFEELFKLNLSTHPLYVEKRYLSVLSKIYDIDIVGLSEAEAREMLNLFYELRKYAGTVYVLKKVLSIFFADIVVDDQVGNFEFDLSMELQNDVSFQKIEKIKTLINKYKNVRSHLRNIILNYPNQQLNLKMITASTFGVDIYADTLLEHSVISKNFFVSSGLSYRAVPKVERTLLEHSLNDNFYLTSGVSARVQLQTNAEVVHEMRVEAKVSSGMNYRVVFDTKSNLENLTTNIQNKGGLTWRL